MIEPETVMLQLPIHWIPVNEELERNRVFQFNKLLAEHEGKAAFRLAFNKNKSFVPILCFRSLWMSLTESGKL